MGHKVFPCVICGKEVSRRKSFDLRELNGEEGRACRDHPEVMEMVRKKLDEAEMQKQLEKSAKDMKEAWQVLNLTNVIRVLHTLHGTPPELVYCDLRLKHGLSEEMIQKVKDEVEKRGGPLMSNDEVLDSMIAYSTLMKKSQKS